jgi:hypothetical protein
MPLLYAMAVRAPGKQQRMCKATSSIAFLLHQAPGKMLAAL